MEFQGGCWQAGEHQARLEQRDDRREIPKNKNKNETGLTVPKIIFEASECLRIHSHGLSRWSSG